MELNSVTLLYCSTECSIKQRRQLQIHIFNGLNQTVQFPPPPPFNEGQLFSVGLFNAYSCMFSRASAPVCVSHRFLHNRLSAYLQVFPDYPRLSGLR